MLFVLKMQDKVFFLNLVLKYVNHLKFTNEVLKWTAPYCITLNWTMWSQTKACIAKSCEICILPRYYMAQSGNSAPMFWDNPSVPASRARKSKRE